MKVIFQLKIFNSLFFLIHIFYIQAQAQDIATGQEVYKKNCITCHGSNFDGKGDAGKYMKPIPRNLKGDKFNNGDTAEQIFATVTNGYKDGSTGMISFAKILSDDDRKSVAAYIVSIRKK